MTTKSVMIQATSSHAGKSFLVAGLCRWFYREGYKVAPFKSQNMALNSYVTVDGGEIGRAQGMQAEAAGITATVDMNPILLKPREDMVAQVIVRGKPYASMSARAYRDDYIPVAIEIVRESLDNLRNEYQVLVIEGAGSPAEINLKDKDIANMKVASLAEAPVIIVADIDRGGAFAAIIGTLELLTPEEREMVAGFIINKFRGDASLLQPALDFLEERTGRPVLGVVPFIPDPGIEEEDSVTLQDKTGRMDSSNNLDIAVIRLPRIANYTDFDPLEAEGDVTLRFVKNCDELDSPAVIILPGTKNTTADLKFLHDSGLAERIIDLYNRKETIVVGVCGGFQMLGEDLKDPHGTESDRNVEIKGLGLLPVSTVFNKDKITRQVTVTVSGHEAWKSLAGMSLQGYEIRHGRSETSGNLPCISVSAGGYIGGGDGLKDVRINGINEGRNESSNEMNNEGNVGTGDARIGGSNDGSSDGRNESVTAGRNEVIGLAAADGRAWGTYLHNLFHNDIFRHRWLNIIREETGRKPLPEDEERIISTAGLRQESYNRLADVLNKHLDMDKICSLMGLDYQKRE